MKEKEEQLLKKYPYGIDVFKVDFMYEGHEQTIYLYSKHLSIGDRCLLIDIPEMEIKWEDVLNIELSHE